MLLERISCACLLCRDTLPDIRCQTRDAMQLHVPEQDENSVQGLEVRVLRKLQDAKAAGVPSTHCHGSFTVTTRWQPGLRLIPQASVKKHAVMQTVRGPVTSLRGDYSMPDCRRMACTRSGRILTT